MYWSSVFYHSDIITASFCSVVGKLPGQTSSVDSSGAPQVSTPPQWAGNQKDDVQLLPAWVFLKRQIFLLNLYISKIYSALIYSNLKLKHTSDTYCIICLSYLEYSGCFWSPALSAPPLSVLRCQILCNQTSHWFVHTVELLSDPVWSHCSLRTHIYTHTDNTFRLNTH